MADLTATPADLELMARLNGWLAELTYRPEWQLVVYGPGDPVPPNHDHVYRRVAIAIGAKGLYLNDEGKAVGTGIGIFSIGVPYSATRDAAFAAVFLLIRRIEDHEREEWFRHGGKPVYPPHSSDGRLLIPLADRTPRGWGPILPEFVGARRKPWVISDPWRSPFRRRKEFQEPEDLHPDLGGRFPEPLTVVGPMIGGGKVK